ncbi:MULTISPECIES: hypothetical protein [Luteimonas]|uniref:hypothetical protein n=1 Tax=Luteimonas TaxID=83614 RepID=UPI00117C4D5D|nr:MULTISPECIES: hypothetical protein [Luteimonas]
MSEFRGLRRVGLLAAALFALVACDAPAPEATARGPQRVSAPPPPEALPNCQAIATVLGDLVTGLDVVDADGSRQNTPESYGLSCAWRASADGGALGVIVIVDREPLTATDMQRAGMYVADPRLAALDGFIAVPDARFEGSEALGPVGPQVIVGAVTVTLATNGQGAIASTTLDRAVDGAVAVHRLLR